LTGPAPFVSPLSATDTTTPNSPISQTAITGDTAAFAQLFAQMTGSPGLSIPLPSRPLAGIPNLFAASVEKTDDAEQPVADAAAPSQVPNPLLIVLASAAPILPASLPDQVDRPADEETIPSNGGRQQTAARWLHLPQMLDRVGQGGGPLPATNEGSRSAADPGQTDRPTALPLLSGQADARAAPRASPVVAEPLPETTPRREGLFGESDSVRLEPERDGSAVDAAPMAAGEPNAPPRAAAQIPEAASSLTILSDGLVRGDSAEPRFEAVPESPLHVASQQAAIVDADVSATPPSDRGDGMASTVSARHTDLSGSSAVEASRTTLTTVEREQPPSAAAVPAADPPENARRSDRFAAPMQPTKTSTESPDAAFSAPSKTAGGERRGASPSERRSPPNADLTAGVGAFTRAEAPESVSSTPNTEHRTPNTDTDRLRVVEQVTQKIETMRLAHGRQEVTLRLHPEHLGELRLTVVADRENVTARIVAETPFVRQVVEEGKEHLRAALEQKGFTLQGLDVALNQGGGERRFAPFLPDYQPPSPRTHHHPAEAAAAEPMLARAARTTPLRINGRLDYQA